MKVQFVVDGEPFGKERPRLGRFGVHTPQKTLNYENYVRWIYKAEGGEFLEGMIRAEIIAYYSIPKSTSKKKAALMIEGKIRPTKKPDTDNVCKAILDSLNKIAYHDDSAVVEVTVKKYYSLEPRVEVTLETID